MQASESACHDSMDTDKDMEFLGQRQIIMLFTAQPVLGMAETCASFLCSQVSGGYTEGQIKPAWAVCCTLRDFSTPSDLELKESFNSAFCRERHFSVFKISGCPNIQRKKWPGWKSCQSFVISMHSDM